MNEVTTILGLCGSEVADYFFESEVEAVASALESEVLAARPLELDKLDVFEVTLGHSLTRCPFCPQSRHKPWSIRC